MAKLSYQHRKGMKSDDFALPSKRKGGKGGYPIPDIAHGRNADARAAQAEKRGTITKAEEQTIERRVHAKFPSIGKRKRNRQPSGRGGLIRAAQ